MTVPQIKIFNQLPSRDCQDKVVSVNCQEKVLQSINLRSLIQLFGSIVMSLSLIQMKLWQCQRYVIWRLLDQINCQEGRCLDCRLRVSWDLVDNDGLLQLYFRVCFWNADSFIITGLATTEQFVMISSWVCTMKHYELDKKIICLPENFCEVTELYFLD